MQTSFNQSFAQRNALTSQNIYGSEEVGNSYLNKTNVVDTMTIQESRQVGTVEEMQTTFGMLDYIDGQIATGRETGDDRSIKSIMEVQRAYKDRMTKTNILPSSYLGQERRVVSVAERRHEDSPESHRDHNMSRHRN